jgi:hypothetical protein
MDRECKVKNRIATWRLKRKWRWVSLNDYPLEYTGPQLYARGVKLETGTPLRKVPGPRGGPGGKRYMAPDFIERILYQSETKKR